MFMSIIRTDVNNVAEHRIKHSAGGKNRQIVYST